MAAKLLKKRFNIQNVNNWLAENDENMDGKLKHTNKFNFHLIKLIFIMQSMASHQNELKNITFKI